MTLTLARLHRKADDTTARRRAGTRPVSTWLTRAVIAGSGVSCGGEMRRVLGLDLHVHPSSCGRIMVGNSGIPQRYQALFEVFRSHFALPGAGCVALHSQHHRDRPHGVSPLRLPDAGLGNRPHRPATVGQGTGPNSSTPTGNRRSEQPRSHPGKPGPTAPEAPRSRGATESQNDRPITGRVPTRQHVRAMAARPLVITTVGRSVARGVG